MLGRTIPCFDYLGFKSGFSIDKPWLYQDFDLLDFYRVSEEELDKQLLLFRSGRYKFEYTNEEFDMAEHNKFLAETADEVKEIRAKQREVQKEMIAAEKESLAKWREDRAKNKVDESTVDALLAGTLQLMTLLTATNLSMQIQRSHLSMHQSMPMSGRLWSRKVKKSKPTMWSLFSKP